MGSSCENGRGDTATTLLSNNKCGKGEICEIVGLDFELILAWNRNNLGSRSMYDFDGRSGQLDS